MTTPLTIVLYLLAGVGVWTLISFAVAPFIGRWLDTDDTIHQHLDELGKTPVPEIEAQRIADYWQCEQLEQDNWKADR